MTTPPHRVLVLDDDKGIRDIIGDLLKQEGYAVDLFDEAEGAYSAALHNTYSLFVLDWNLPGMSGVELTRKLRACALTRTSPILMLTGRTATDEIVQAMDSGVDDYVTKPFELRVLVARLRSLIRRAELTSQKTPHTHEITVGSLRLLREECKVFCGKTELNLTRYEFKLLLTLLEGRGKVMTREQIIKTIQGSGVNVIDRAVDTHVFWLRQKLLECAALVETVRGVGYRVGLPMGS